MENADKMSSTKTSSMSEEQREQYKRIQSFALDEPDVQLPFSQRLAQENRWTAEYAKKVISEYLKFAFLAVNAGHPVTPSKAVDMAWHLHLTYTKSYWQVFCPQVLQTSLHHEPTQGGTDEEQKFEDWYCKTLESYRRFFEQSPPSDIWPSQERADVPGHTSSKGQEPPFLLDSQRQMVFVVSIAALAGLMLGSFKLGRSQLEIEFIEAVPMLLLGLVVGFGALQMLAGLFLYLRHPSRSVVAGGCSGGIAGGCGGASEGHSFGSGDSGSCGGSCGGGCGGSCGGGRGGG